MSESNIENHLKRQRKAAGLSQSVLAERVGVSRQAILAIEAGRNVPSTSLGLRLAYALGCTVEDIFRLAPEPGLHARLAPASGGEAGPRVALGQVDGRWVAHRLPAHGMTAADGIVVSEGDGSTAVVRPLGDSAHLERNVLVAGCAPLLGAVGHRVGRRFADARMTWLQAGNRQAMDLLAAGLVHVAGLHLSGDHDDLAAAARRALPGRRLVVVNLTRWQQGLVVPPGNPLGIDTGADLLRPDLRVVRREEGSGAHDLAARFLGAEGACHPDGGPAASSHREVARLVRSDYADVGIAIESAALAEGLEFVPLVEERFDLVVAQDTASRVPVSRLIETLDDPDFRSEVEHLPGYDGSLSGEVTTVEAA